MKRLLALLSWVLVIAYPFIVFLGLLSFSTKVLGVGLIALALARILLGKLQAVDTVLPMLFSILMGLLAAYALLADSAVSLLYYPVGVNIVLLSVFTYSLFSGPSFIERLARITEPDLSARAVNYTRRVTVVWCVFFVSNGSMAFFTAQFASREIWVLYNGFIAYLLMGLIMSVEFIIRRRVKRAEYVGTT